VAVVAKGTGVPFMMASFTLRGPVFRELDLGVDTALGLYVELKGLNDAFACCSSLSDVGRTPASSSWGVEGLRFLAEGLGDCAPCSFASLGDDLGESRLLRLLKIPVNIPKAWRFKAQFKFCHKLFDVQNQRYLTRGR
jgi:hypothetical protein